MYILMVCFACTTESSYQRSVSTQHHSVPLDSPVETRQESTGDCDLVPYFRAYDTPLPSQEELVSLCSDPVTTLQLYTTETQDSRVRKGSYYLLGYFTEDPKVYQFLANVVFQSEDPNSQLAALQGLTINGLPKEDLLRLDPLLDTDHRGLQYQVAKLYKENKILEPIRSRFDRLHPSVQRITRSVMP